MRDEEISIQALQEGEKETFRTIYERYHTRLCYFASKILPEGEAPEDVIQDVFVKLWQNKENFEKVDSVKSFLYITTRNHCLNLHKHNKVVQQFTNEPTPDIKDGLIINHLIESEVLDKVHRAIEKLPLGCRNVMLLSYFEEMKNREVAEYLKISVNTVKTQKQRGVNLLRSLLKMTPFWPVISMITNLF